MNTDLIVRFKDIMHLSKIQQTISRKIDFIQTEIDFYLNKIQKESLIKKASIKILSNIRKIK